MTRKRWTSTVLCALLSAPSWAAPSEMCEMKVTGAVEESFRVEIPEGAPANMHSQGVADHWMPAQPGGDKRALHFFTVSCGSPHFLIQVRPAKGSTAADVPLAPGRYEVVKAGDKKTPGKFNGFASVFPKGGKPSMFKSTGPGEIVFERLDKEWMEGRFSFAAKAPNKDKTVTASGTFRFRNRVGGGLK